MRQFKLAYSSIRPENPDLDKLLASMAKEGWEGWEIRPSLDWLGSAKRVREICDRMGMPPANVTARGISLDGDYAMMELNRRRMEFAAEVGADCYMFMGARPVSGKEATQKAIRALADVSEKLADYGGQLGLDVCYHPHTATTVDCAEDFHTLMELLDKCKLCIDVSHLALWELDPCEEIQRYRDRLIYIHLQNWRGYRYLELGEGNLVDLPQVLETLEEIGFNRWVTAVPGRSDRTDEEKVSLNRQYLRNLGY